MAEPRGMGYSNVNTDLYLYNLQTGTTEHLTPHKGNIFYRGDHWLTDESAFFFVQDKEREFNGLARYTITKKKSEYVLTPNWDISEIAIDKNSKNIAVVVNEAGYKRAILYDPIKFKQQHYSLPSGNVSGVNFSNDGSQMVFNLGDSRNTLNVWALVLKTGESYQLTHSHQYVPPEAMVEPELTNFVSFDGLSVPIFVYRPKKVKQGMKASVLINIHGGPEEQYQPTYKPVTQYLVHNGYTVIAPNVRGSHGYGKSYMALDDTDKRMDSVKDIIALREHITGMHDIDTTKIVLYGTSYGGFMVLACITFYPKLWAAAVNIVGIANFVTFLENIALYRRALREAEYGSLQNDMELLKKISPIHSVEKIETPLLLIHGANDTRVPLSEAEQIVQKLKEMDKHIKLLIYSDEGHGIVKLKNKLDMYPKIIKFLDEALA